jgi:hypothetical protein
MVRAIVHKEGDRVLFEVSHDAPEARNLQDGQEIVVTFGPPTAHEMTDEEFVDMVDQIIDEDREALEYLAQ